MSIVFEFARTDTPEDPYAFSFEPQAYTLRTRHGGRKRVHLDWSDQLIDDLAALNEPHCDPTVVQRVGRALHSFLEPGGWSWHAQAIAQTAQQSHQVYLTIRSAAAELYALPWELLSLEGTGQFVGELPTVLVRYEWPETHSAAPGVVSSGSAGSVGARPGNERILLAWSEAGGAVPHREHTEAIRMACQAASHDFDPDRDVLANASVGKLADALERSGRSERPITALHLVCHGGKVGQTNGLMLDGERGGAVAVDALRVRQIIAPHASTLRLVGLMACESADGGQFDNIAQSLHRAGIQSVVGSRFLLSVPGSVAVAETLYQALLVQHKPLEEAFLAARRQLARDPSHLDWASLQLYARRADGDATFPLGLRPDEASKTRNPSDVMGQIAFGLLDLPTLLQLRDMADREIGSRFTRELTLVCVELVDTRLGLGPKNPGAFKRCRELLAAHAMPQRGLLFSDAGERLRVCYPDIKLAIKATMAFCEALTEHNYHEARENQLVIRVGVHHGPVVHDGEIVTGPAVDLVGHITDAARNGEIMLSEPALRAVPKLTQALCNAAETIEPEQVRQPLQLYRLWWRNDARLPVAIQIEQLGVEGSVELRPLPSHDLISFGRLDALPDGTTANDIVLHHADDKVQRAISRWHFELRRIKAGYVLRSLSGQGTEVDDEKVSKGQESPVAVGTTICVAKRLRLVLQGRPESDVRRDAATMTIGFTG